MSEGSRGPRNSGGRTVSLIRQHDDEDGGDDSAPLAGEGRRVDEVAWTETNGPPQRQGEGGLRDLRKTYTDP